MSNYIAFLHAGIEKPGARPLEDGKALAKQCLDKLRKTENPEQFPPKLLLLLVSAKYLGGEGQLNEVRARQLIAGVRQSFSEANHSDVPLIGSSVAAVFYEREIYREGVLLICLASRMLDATVSVGTKVSEDPKAAVKSLIDGLHIEEALNEYPRALPNRVLLTFFPGTNPIGKAGAGSTDKLHTALLENLTYQIPVIGGVSSANDPKRSTPGLQFVEQQTFSDALAACLIRSGLPIASSMSKGLESTNEVLRVKTLSDDGRLIETFEGDRSLPEIFQHYKTPILLRDFSPESDVVRAKWLPNSDGTVTVLREVRPFTSLELTIPSPKKMYDETRAAHRLSLQRAKIKSPAGCISFKCSGHLDYSAELGLDLRMGMAAMQDQFSIPVYVGGFYDGEIATTAAGAFTCGGWSVGALIFGDEISERTAVQGGFSAVAQHGVALTNAFELNEALNQSLEMVHSLGFPGSMISVLMPDHNPDLLPEQKEQILVPLAAKGARFERAFKLLTDSGIGGPMPREVDKTGKPVFHSHLELPANGNRDLFRAAGIINEYLFPLRDSANQVFGLLRIDLGTQRFEDLHPAVKEVLNSIAAMVTAAFVRIFNWEENRIARELDRVLKKSMAASTRKEGLQHFLQAALKIFDLPMGHIRLVNAEKHSLVLEAGQGAYYEAAQVHRDVVSFEDWSPSCEAFIRQTTTIINDALNNSAHEKMCQKWIHQRDMYDILYKLGSYASIPFKSEKGDRLGTINLLAPTRWFFQSYHERALTSLSRRVGFLVEHLVNKEEAKRVKQQADKAQEVTDSLRLVQRALRARLEFINKVGKTLDFLSGAEDFHGGTGPALDFVVNADLITNDTSKVLNVATQSFCELLGASSGALYLWDEEQQQYILRGQAGWKDENWTGAARYRRTDDWVGTKGLADRPRYIPDLYQYYFESHYAEPSGRYAVPIFGDPLSANFTVEVIASQLRLAGRQFGVLTLYGKPGPRVEITQFTTTAVSVLEESIGRFAGLVSVLLSSQSALEQQLASKRRITLFDSVTHQNEQEPFEEMLCESIARVFDLSRIVFFKKRSKQSDDLMWAHGIEIAAGDGHITVLEPRSVDEFVRESARTESILPIRARVPAEAKSDPDVAVTEGRIQRCLIPLVARGTLTGIMDLHWDVRRLANQATINFFSDRERDELGKMLGSLYAKNRILVELAETKKREVASQELVNALDGLFGFAVHDIRTLLGQLKLKALNISKPPEAKSAAEIVDLVSLIDENIPFIEQLVGVAESKRAPKWQYPLREIVDEAIKQSGIKHQPKIELEIDVPETLSVFANYEVVRETCVNVIRNSIEAMPHGGVVTITATPLNNNMVQMVLLDTGEGMTEEDHEQVKSRSTTKPGRRRGLGLPLSIAAISMQGGSFDFKSSPGGTGVTITLPTKQTKE